MVNRVIMHFCVEWNLKTKLLYSRSCGWSRYDRNNNSTKMVVCLVSLDFKRFYYITYFNMAVKFRYSSTLCSPPILALNSER